MNKNVNVNMDPTFQEKLIDEVHRKVHPLLDKQRKNVPKVHQKSWEEIALRLGEDASTCSRTWKKVRDDYVRARKKSTIISPGSILEKMQWLSSVVPSHEPTVSLWYI